MPVDSGESAGAQSEKAWPGVRPAAQAAVNALACLAVKRLCDLKRQCGIAINLQRSIAASIVRVPLLRKIRISGKGGRIDRILREDFECDNHLTNVVLLRAEAMIEMIRTSDPDRIRERL